MKVYTIFSLTVKEVLNELAELMNAELTENFTEYSLSIPSDLGEGEIQGVNFPNGVGMLSFKGIFKQEVAFHFKSSNVHPLKFLYVIQGKLNHSIEPDGERRAIEELQSAMISTYYHHGHIYKFPADEEFFVQTIEIDRKKFQAHIEYHLEEMPYYFYKIFADIEGVNPLFFKSNYSLDISRIIYEIESFPKNGFIRINFLGAKSLEILSAMLSQYEDDQVQDAEQNILRKSEVKRIHNIANHIDENYASFKNIDELASQFGLSQGKIQQGFQLQYQKTVNEYLVNIRLNQAIRLLQEGDKNISEIVYAVGLSSRSYFSKIFKERFKISPSAYLKSLE